MKNLNNRIFALLLAAILCLCLAGCSKAVLPKALKDEFAASEDFIDFVSITKFNDDYSLCMELNDKNEITGFTTGYISFY